MEDSVVPLSPRKVKKEELKKKKTDGKKKSQEKILSEYNPQNTYLKGIVSTYHIVELEPEHHNYPWCVGTIGKELYNQLKKFHHKGFFKCCATVIYIYL